MPHKNRADSSDEASDGTPPVEPKGAPELDPKLLDAKRQAEIDAAFSVERDADVVAELPEETTSTEEPAAADNSQVPPEPAKPAGDSRFKRFWHGFWRRKLWTIPLAVLVLLAVLLAVPASRYLLLGTFVKNDVTLLILDQTTHRPVISAVIESGGISAMTDSEGRATLRLPVGERDFTISKRYYRSTDFRMLVPAFKNDVNEDVKIQATGRQVPVAVVNKLSGKPLENVTLEAAGTEVKTDKDGKALLVVPADKPAQEVAMTNGGFNELKATLTVTEQAVPQNNFAMTPTGKVYFLSKQSGKIDVVKTDLDGANRQTVVAGTGREDEGGTVMLASRDWKYLALLSRRESDRAKLYLIETASDKITVIDEGNVTFGMIGWSDDSFVYNVTRQERKEWQPGRLALKSYKVAGAKLTTLDQNEAEGDQSNYKSSWMNSLTLIGDKLVYVINWNYSGWGQSLEGKNIAIRSVSVNGQNKKDLKTLPAHQHYMYDAKLYAPGELYYMYTTSGKLNTYDFLEYENGVVKPVEGDFDNFANKPYPTFLESPDKKRTFWSEQRDGKETFFVGNAAGEDAKQVASLPEHFVYGWYTDGYLLVSKKGSELFIMPVDGSKQSKIADYHKPNYSFRGYGGGYGGL